MGDRPTLPDEVRTTLPEMVQEYITALETALSVASGEAEALRTRLNRLETGSWSLVKHRGWPDGFIEWTAGAWQGAPPERGDQGEYEEREPLA
jgi:cation transport regulator ChaB